MLGFWEAVVFGVVVGFGTMFLARKIAPRKSYFDLHPNDKKTIDY